jgi:hypothetical protein
MIYLTGNFLKSMTKIQKTKPLKMVVLPSDSMDSMSSMPGFSECQGEGKINTPLVHANVQIGLPSYNKNQMF